MAQPNKAGQQNNQQRKRKRQRRRRQQNAPMRNFNFSDYSGSGYSEPSSYESYSSGGLGGGGGRAGSGGGLGGSGGGLGFSSAKGRKGGGDKTNVDPEAEYMMATSRAEDQTLKDNNANYMANLNNIYGGMLNQMAPMSDRYQAENAQIAANLRGTLGAFAPAYGTGMAGAGANAMDQQGAGLANMVYGSIGASQLGLLANDAMRELAWGQSSMQQGATEQMEAGRAAANALQQELLANSIRRQGIKPDLRDRKQERWERNMAQREFAAGRDDAAWERQMAERELARQEAEDAAYRRALAEQARIQSLRKKKVLGGKGGKPDGPNKGPDGPKGSDGPKGPKKAGPTYGPGGGAKREAWSHEQSHKQWSKEHRGLDPYEAARMVERGFLWKHGKWVKDDSVSAPDSSGQKQLAKKFKVSPKTLAAKRRQGFMLSSNGKWIKIPTKAGKPGSKDPGRDERLTSGLAPLSPGSRASSGAVADWAKRQYANGASIYDAAREMQEAGIKELSDDRSLDTLQEIMAYLHKFGWGNPYGTASTPTYGGGF